MPTAFSPSSLDQPRSRISARWAAQGAAVGDRLVGDRIEARRQVGVEIVVGQTGEQRLAQRRGVRRQPSADRREQPQLLGGLPLGEVHDVGAVESSEVHRLVEIGHQRVEHRRRQRHDRVAVDVGGADAHGPHPIDSRPAASRCTHPRRISVCTTTWRLLFGAPRSQREIGERRRPSLGETLEDLHGSHRRLGIALAARFHTGLLPIDAAGASRSVDDVPALDRARRALHDTVHHSELCPHWWTHWIAGDHRWTVGSGGRRESSREGSNREISNSAPASDAGDRGRHGGGRRAGRRRLGGGEHHAGRHRRGRQRGRWRREYLVEAHDGPYVVGLANAFVGNSWRNQMVAELQYAADQNPRSRTCSSPTPTTTCRR